MNQHDVQEKGLDYTTADVASFPVVGLRDAAIEDVLGSNAAVEDTIGDDDDQEEEDVAAAAAGDDGTVVAGRDSTHDVVVEASRSVPADLQAGDDVGGGDGNQDLRYRDSQVALPDTCAADSADVAAATVGADTYRMGV